MHELSMAQAIVDTVLDAAEKNNATEVVEVTIEVGMLTMLNPEQLKFLLEVIVEDTLLENAEIIIEDVPVEKIKFVTEIHHAVANVIQPKVVVEAVEEVVEVEEGEEGEEEKAPPAEGDEPEKNE